MAYLRYIKKEGEKGKCFLTHDAGVMNLHRLCIKFSDFSEEKKNCKHSKNECAYLQELSNISVSRAIFSQNQNTHTHTLTANQLDARAKERRGEKSNNV